MSIEDPGQADDTPATPELLSQNTTSQKTGLAEPGPPSQAVDEEAAGLSAELSLDNANVTKEKLCGVCNEKPSKYKCARCYLP